MSHSLDFLRDNKWLPVFVLSWLFLLIFFGSGRVLQGMPESSVPFSFQFIEKARMVLALLTLAGFAESAVLYSEKHRNLFLQVTLFFLLPFGLLTYVALSTSVPEERFKVVDTASLEGNEYVFVYYLMYGDSIYDTGGFASARLYVLYKCSWDIFCNEIFRQRTAGHIVSPHDLFLAANSDSVTVVDAERHELYRCTPHEGDCSLR